MTHMPPDSERTRDDKTDLTTNARTRAYLSARLQDDCARASASGQTLSCILVDIAGYRSLAERLNPAFCDRLLRKLADLLRTYIGTSDCLVRYGVDKFLLLFPNLSASQAIELSERISTAVHMKNFDDRAGHLGLACSVGVASYPTAGLIGPSDLLQQVEASLADAKVRRRT